VYLFVFLTIVGELVLRRTTFGRAAYATGGNREVARIAGINVGRIKTVNFVVTGALAGLCGILVMASVASASSDIGDGYELIVIASVVIGGVSLFGGVGSVIGAFLGVLLLQVVQSGLVVSGLSANWQTVAVGAIMILAVGMDVLRRRIRTG
jgi:ribose transport system permease protein